MNLRPPATADVIAGLSVAVVLIPQAMAYAELAGLPPQVGLFSAALPLIVAAPLVSSPYLQTGPVALTGLLTFGALAGRAPTFSAEYIELAVLLALMVGILRLLLGLARLGTIAYLLSDPVLGGFTTGAAILILASQLPGAVGAQPTGTGVLKRAVDTVASPQSWQVGALLFTGATAALMVGGRRIHRFFPGVFVAVMGAILLSAAVGYGGETIGELPGGFIRPHTVFPWNESLGLLPAAAAIALVGFAEPASIARAFAAQDRQRWDANKEMVGQGVANIASALSGGLPVGGSFSRSALGRMAGAKTAWTGAIAGIIVLFALPLRSIARLFTVSVPQGVVGLGTLGATLAFAPRVERGIFVGVALSIGVHLYRELNVVADEQVTGSTLTISPRGVLWFATVPRIEAICRTKLADDPTIDTIVLDLAGVGRLDYTGAATLQQSITTFEATSIRVKITNVGPGAKRAASIHFTPQ